MTLRILALDTATPACSVALWQDGNIIANQRLVEQQHSQYILPMIEQLLAESQLSLSQLDALAVGQGPGSFTGVRMAVSVAQGLAFGANLPVLPISTLAILAEQVYQLTGHSRVLTAIDARMNELYWAVYQKDVQQQWQCYQTEQVIAAEQIEQQVARWPTDYQQATWATAGTGWQVVPQLLNQQLTLVNSSVIYPYAEFILPLAVTAWQQQLQISAQQLQPSYLRNDVAWKKSS